MEQKIDKGLLCFLKLKGNVLIQELLDEDKIKSPQDLRHEQSYLAIYPVSMDQTVYQENKKIKHPDVPGGRFQVDAEENVSEKFDHNCLECLIGTREGTIYVYDPVLIMKGNVYSYNDAGTPFHKNKRPDIVRWIEPTLSTNPILQLSQQTSQTRAAAAKDVQQQPAGSTAGAQKFAVSFEDGCIYIYYKGEPSTAREDYTKQMIQVASNQGNNQQKDGKNMISKSDIVLKMQKLIEDYDFEQAYGSGQVPPTNQDRREERKTSEAEMLGGAKNNLKECLVHNEDVYHGIITHKSRIYDLKNKHYNYTVAYYSKNDKAINPKLMMRFDCHKINEMQCVKLIEKVNGDDAGLAGEQRSQQRMMEEYEANT